MARAAAATTAGRAVPARRAPAPRRRASGGVRAQPAKRPIALPRGARVLDALLTGRVWIALVGVLLAGIVFFNVDLLRMNRDITQMADRSDALQRQNARIREEVAHLASSERIQEAAAKLGLVLPEPGDVRYLRSNPKVDARNASKRIIAPTEAYTPFASSTTGTTSSATGTTSSSTTGTTPGTTSTTTPSTTGTTTSSTTGTTSGTTGTTSGTTGTTTPSSATTTDQGTAATPTSTGTQGASGAAVSGSG
jgi:cell division protein FtsL